MREIVLVLHNIRSLYNVGSIFRTAETAGVSKIYICGITPQPSDFLGNYRKEISKVALGAEKIIPWEYNRFTLNVLKKLKEKGYKIVAVEQSPKAISYFKFCPSKKAKIALVLGNEVKGISQKILDFSDKILEIPMLGKKESLNVSVAFGVVVFYLRFFENHKK